MTEDDFRIPGENYRPIDPLNRGKHATFDSALSAATDSLKGLLAERSPFYDSLTDHWREVFPKLPARPGRLDNGTFVIYVANPPTLFLLRSRLGSIRRQIAALPGAPKKVEIRLEVHS